MDKHLKLGKAKHQSPINSGLRNTSQCFHKKRESAASSFTDGVSGIRLSSTILQKAHDLPLKTFSHLYCSRGRSTAIASEMSAARQYPAAALSSTMVHIIPTPDWIRCNLRDSTNGGAEQHVGTSSLRLTA